MKKWFALFAFGLLVWSVSIQAAPEAIEIGPANVGLLPGGKEADGIVGDFLMRNDRVEAVVSGNLVLRRANMSTFYGTNGMTPGCLYDLTLRGHTNDQLTIFSPSGQQGKVSYVRIVDPGATGQAVIETVVTAANNQGVFRRHEYRLKDGWSGVLIVTTFRNERSETVRFAPDDRIETFARRGQFQGISWVDAIDPADRVGYAYDWVAVDGTKAPPRQLSLKPGEERTIARFVAVGSSPAEAVGRLAAFDQRAGEIRTRIVGPDSQPIRSAILRIQQGEEIVLGYANMHGEVHFPFPTGDYSVEATDPGRNSVTNSIKVEANQTANSEAKLGPASGIAVRITYEDGRPIPCKVQFIGVEGTPSPNFGPANRAHGCLDQYHSENGQFEVQLRPGKYQVIVTRGVEFSHLSKTVEVREGETTKVEGALRRLVDSRGWVSADYHNHSTQSGDNTCGTDDRIINLAAEQIEFAPTTEHNRLYDWRPHIEKLGLSKELNTVSGLELTGSGPHFNAFPFAPESRTQDNGAPVWNRDPRITAVTLRNWQHPEPDRWIQINHPDLIENFIDRNGDGLADGGYIELGALIDGLEVQNYRPSTILSGMPFQITRRAGVESLFYNREFVWLQLLNQGHRLVGMAVCDAHSVHGNGVGGWRMYFPSASDEPAQIDWRENSRHAKAGRSIMTTGPFLQVTTDDGQGPGSDVRASKGVKLKVRVQCTDWIDIDRVQVLVNGRPDPKLNYTRKSHPDWFGSGVVKFDRSLDVPLTQDAHLIVVAYGEGFDLKLGYGSSAQSELKPCAYNNPIFVDVDGGGFRANGDLLDYGLMTKRYKLEGGKIIDR